MKNRSGNLVLIVDDREDDQVLLVRALRRLRVQNQIRTLEDGHEVVRYLNGDPPYDDRTEYPLPLVLFLDLKLPVLSGWDVLDWIHGLSMKGDRYIVIYSDLSDIDARVYKLGADFYLSKPLKDENLRALLEQFPAPWEFDPKSDS